MPRGRLFTIVNKCRSCGLARSAIVAPNLAATGTSPPRFCWGPGFGRPGGGVCRAILEPLSG